MFNEAFGWLSIKASGVITGCYRRTLSSGSQDVNRDVIITDCFQLTEYIYIITTHYHPQTSHLTNGLAAVTNLG